MLAGHAATLEAVSFIGADLSPIDAAFFPIDVDAALSPLRLLVGMPNLRQLTSRLMPGLREVAACKSLRSLKLTVDAEVESVSQEHEHGALELLRSAHQLRSLHLHFLHDVDVDEDGDIIEIFADDLIGALASSGRSQVEVLFIEVEGASHDLILGQLGSALPSLPSLRRLEINMDQDPDMLLRLITPVTAPSLRSLQIRAFEATHDICAHAFLHSEELESLMSRNPLLHVEQQYVSCRAFRNMCDVCKLSCHKDVDEFELLGTFAHPKDECPSPEAHAAIERCCWVHINDVQH
ncbi:uncharacterized protein LOC127749318 [Frankliniella occidentalis]|uniref:Uncharacterized protein LOC127749318 n=1 Tax=Frankliniella occidentalis TaxID=133901 RepID=A0A9C6WXJ4_FRAOC|nr:uncharacterized protein LOC127749318 [Frankliniella occidentalis]